MPWLADEFRREQGIDLRQDTMALQRLKEASERAKKELSASAQTEINLPFITADASGPKHLAVMLTRAKLEKLVDDLIERSARLVNQRLIENRLSASQIDEVLLVGGKTRMPAVVSLVKQAFNKEPYQGINPYEVEALGAAIQAGTQPVAVREMVSRKGDIPATRKPNVVGGALVGKSIFISHSSIDNEWCGEFATYLTEAGADVWYDASGLHGGTAWVQTIGHQFESRELFLVLLTPQAWESECRNYFHSAVPRCWRRGAACARDVKA